MMGGAKCQATSWSNRWPGNRLVVARVKGNKWLRPKGQRVERDNNNNNNNNNNNPCDNIDDDNKGNVIDNDKGKGREGGGCGERELKFYKHATGANKQDRKSVV